MRSLVRRPAETSPEGLPWVVLNVDGRARATTDSAEVEELIGSGAASPVRAFKSHSTSRSTPERPYVDELGPHPDVESGLEGIHAALISRQPTASILLAQGLWVGPPWSCPDFAVVTSNAGLIIIEAKARTALATRKTRAQVERARSDLAALGLRYEVVCDLSEVAMWNYKLLSLKRIWQSRWGDEVREAAEVLLDLAGTATTIQRLWDEGLLPRPRLKSLVWHLCWRGDLCFDWESRLGPNAEVWAHGDRCHEDAPASEWRTVCGPDSVWTLPRKV